MSESIEETESNEPVDDSVRGILRFAFPLFGNALVTFGFMIVDSLMIAPLGEASFAGTGQGSYFYLLVCSFFTGILSLYTPYAARLSPNEPKRKISAFWNALAVACLLSILLFGLASLSGPFFRLWKQPPETIAVVEQFLGVLRWAALPTLLYNCLSQTANIVRMPGLNLVAVMLGNVANVFLNWILIYGNWGAPALGVRGSALATILARCVMIAASFTMLNMRLPKVDRLTNLSGVTFDKEFMKLLAGRGAPRGITYLGDWFLTFVLVLVVGWGGLTPIVANNVTDVISSTMYLVPQAFCEVATVLIASKIALEGTREAVLATVKRIYGVTFAVGAVVIVLVACLLPYLLSAFSLAYGSPTWSLAKGILIVHLAFYFSYIGQHTFLAALDAFLDTRVPSFVSIVVSYAFVLPFVILFAKHGPVMIWSIEGIGITVLSVLYALRIRKHIGALPNN